jgi:hypothetical protein
VNPCFTISRATLIHVKHGTARSQNVTLSLPVSLLRQFRIYAAEQNESMSSLAAEAIRKLVEKKAADEKAKRERAAQRILARLENPPGRGVGDKITWTREEIHERGKGI